jgi:ABC-type protease/lipase transport system fused ATPase/permease subunit
MRGAEPANVGTPLIALTALGSQRRFVAPPQAFRSRRLAVDGAKRVVWGAIPPDITYSTVDVAANRLACILGPNDAGKSTLIRTITGRGAIGRDPLRRRDNH